MLELGNKRRADHPDPYKTAFVRLGIRHTSVDLNGEDGALRLDLRQPLGLGKFDMVTNFGTSEHVSEQEPVWRNICDACSKVFVSMTPETGWENHGIWYPTPGFYTMLAKLNGFKLERLDIHKVLWKNRGTLCLVRMRRSKGIKPFVMPAANLIRRVAARDVFTQRWH